MEYWRGGVSECYAMSGLHPAAAGLGMLKALVGFVTGIIVVAFIIAPSLELTPS
jgi:hypothetical protein